MTAVLGIVSVVTQDKNLSFWHSRLIDACTVIKVHVEQIVVFSCDLIGRYCKNSFLQGFEQMTAFGKCELV